MGTEPTAGERKRRREWIIAIAFCVAIGGCAIAIAVNGTSTSSVTSSNGQAVSTARSEAFDICTQFVKQRLKAPATASFRDPYGDQVAYVGDGEGPITVSASVDSENSFGAKLRLPYSCTVSHASGANWRLDNLDMSDS